MYVHVVVGATPRLGSVHFGCAAGHAQAPRTVGFIGTFLIMAISDQVRECRVTKCRQITLHDHLNTYFYIFTKRQGVEGGACI